MSTAATVPVFAPDGTLGDIPQESLAAAVQKGFKPGVHVTAPDGAPGVIPADRTPDAVKRGLKVVPLESQPAKSFWSEAGSAFWNVISSIPGGIYHAAVDPLTETHASLVDKLHQEQSQDATPPSAERQAHGALYRKVGAPLAEAVGADVKTMEQGAAEVNPGKVEGTAAVVPAILAATEGLARGVPAASSAIKDALPSVERAGEAFQAVSKVVGSHTVPITPGLSDSLMRYQQLVDAGGSRSLVVSKLLNRLTSPTGGPLTYDEARLFQSNISRLSADEAQRLTPVMKRQVGQIASELSGAVENTAANAGQLENFRGAMKEYSAAKTQEARLEVLKKWGIKVAAASALGAGGAAGVRLMQDLSK